MANSVNYALQAAQLAQMLPHNQPALGALTHAATNFSQTPPAQTQPAKPFVLRPLYDKKIDLTKPLRDQRPVLKRSRLRREFEPHRDRAEFGDVEDVKDRRRLRSTDNARLYRDREKQKMIDLEEDIEQLKSVNSRLTIQNTTLKYKFDVLQRYIVTSKPKLAPVHVPPPMYLPPINAHLEQSTQVRDVSTVSTNSALSGGHLDHFTHQSAYSHAEVVINQHGEQMTTVQIPPGLAPSNASAYTTSGIESNSFGSKASRHRNVRNLSLTIGNSNHSSQDNSQTSTKTVLEAARIDAAAKRLKTDQDINNISVASSNAEWSRIQEPLFESSRIEDKITVPDTPSCYGSAEPSPADGVKPQAYFPRPAFASIDEFLAASSRHEGFVLPAEIPKAKFTF